MSATRDAIIEQAARLFYERGFPGVSIDEICAGTVPPLSKGAYYHVFDSKEGVLFAIHEKYMTEAIGHLDALAGLDAIAKFDALFRYSADLLQTMRPFVVATILEQRHLRGDYAARAKRTRQQYRKSIEAIVRQGQREGTLRTDIDVKVMTLNYFAVLNWMYMWYHEGGTLPRRKVVEMCKKQVLGGMQSPAC